MNNLINSEGKESYTSYKNNPIPSDFDKDNFKDEIMLNDLEKFYKKGTFPFIFICHLLCAILTTFIVITESYQLNHLLQHTRAMQSVFYFHEDTGAPTYNYPRKYFFTTLEQFETHLTKIVESIYTVNDTLPYNIHYENEIKMRVLFRDGYYNLNLPSKYPFSFDIKNKNDNPIKRYFGEDIDDLRKFLSFSKNLEIELNYNYNRLHFGICQVISIYLSYDTSRIGYIKFTPNFKYKNCERDITSVQVIKFGFQKANSYINLLLSLLAMVETYMIVKKLTNILKIVFYIKTNLKLIDFFENFSNEDIYLHTGKNKWDLIANKDLFSLFPVWLILFLIGCICQISGGFLYILTPFMNNINQFFFGFSSIFSWISIAYYFQSNSSYFALYSALFKSMKEYRYLLGTFIFLFTGFVLLHVLLFNKCDKWYDGFNGSFLTLFAATLGDLLIDIWKSTLFSDPIATMLLAFVLYVLFLGNHLRVMFVMTQEAYQVANLENKQSWLENQFNLIDYVHQEFSTNQESRKLSKESNFVIDDIWMRALVSQDDVHKILNIDLEQLKLKGYNVDQIQKFLWRIQRNKERTKLSERIRKEMLEEKEDEDIENGKYDHMGKNKQIENLFSNLTNMVNKVERFIEPSFSVNEGKEVVPRINIIIGEICMRMLENLKKLKLKII